MTNRERLISLLGFSPESNSVDGALIDFGIDGTATYDTSKTVLLKKAAIQIMELLLTTADTTNENTYGIRYDRTAVQARIRLLKGEIGLIDESLPFVKSRPVW